MLWNRATASQTSNETTRILATGREAKEAVEARVPKLLGPPKMWTLPYPSRLLAIMPLPRKRPTASLALVCRCDKASTSTAPAAVNIVTQQF